MRLTRNRTLVLVSAGLAAALLLAMFSPLASKSPDGLERVAKDQGFARTEKAPAFKLLADYAFPWVGNDEAANALAGVCGVLLVAGLTTGVAIGLRRLGERPALDEDS